jgi:hypothetical protein
MCQEDYITGSRNFDDACGVLHATTSTQDWVASRGLSFIRKLLRQACGVEEFVKNGVGVEIVWVGVQPGVLPDCHWTPSRAWTRIDCFVAMGDVLPFVFSFALVYTPIKQLLFSIIISADYRAYK